MAIIHNVVTCVFATGPPPQFALTSEGVGLSLDVHEQKPWHVDPTHEGILRKAVPKKRVSWERRQLKKFSPVKIQRHATPKKGIVACVDCGQWHEAHTVCG